MIDKIRKDCGLPPEVAIAIAEKKKTAFNLGQERHKQKVIQLINKWKSPDTMNLETMDVRDATPVDYKISKYALQGLLTDLSLT